MSRRDLIIFISLSFMWSLSFIFYRVGVPEFGSMSFASLRVIFAGLTMLAFVAFDPSQLKAVAKHWKLLTVVGLISTAIPFVLFSYAAQSVNAGVLAVLNAAVPMMSGFIASTFFNDKLSKKQTLGLFIGIAGVIILMSESLFGGAVAALSSSLLPMGYALLGCVGYAVGANVTKNYLQDTSPITITVGAMLIASIVMLPIAIYEFPYGQSISLKAWVSVVCIGVFSTAIAFIFINELIKSIGPMRATSITLVIPIFAIIFGYILLDEALDTAAIIGSAVILIGTYLSLNLSLASFTKSSKSLDIKD